MGDLSNYIKKRGDVNSITATDPGTPPLKPTTNGLNEYVVRHFLKQLGILIIFYGTCFFHGFILRRLSIGF